MRVDHLVWYCADLAEGEAYFAQRMDCRPVYGGVHPGEGTRNCLLSLADTTYVEVLGRDPAQAPDCLDSELRRLEGSGLYHWAVGGTDLARLRAKALASGLDGSDLVTGGRILPDGSRLGWQLFAIRNHDLGAVLPFFIDWAGSEHPAGRAPRGGSLVRLEASTPRPRELHEVYRALGLSETIVTIVEGARSGLSATVASHSGLHVLRMFDPVPRGFVI